MPYLTLDTRQGQYTNTDPWASGRPERMYNVLLDESGTISSRPGLLSFATAPATAGVGGSTDYRVIGLHPYRDRMIAVMANRRILSITSAGTVTDVTGDYLGGWQPPRFLIDGGSDPSTAGRLIIMGGGAPVAIGPNTLQSRRFVVGAAPAPTHGAIIGERIVFNEFGSELVHFSKPDGGGITDGPAAHDDFTPDNLGSGFITAHSDPDAVNGLAGHRGLLFIFGANSMEVYYPTSSVTEPLARRDMPPPSGLGAPQSLLYADNTYWYVDNRRRLVRLDGHEPRAVSLPVEAQLKGLSKFDDCVTHYMEYEGHHLLICHFSRAKVTLVYDPVLDVWSQWGLWSTTTGDWVEMPITAYAYHPEWDKHICAGDENRNIFELSSTTYQDNGNPLVREWTGPYIDAGTMDLKLARRMRMMVDGGRGTTYVASNATNGANETYNPELDVRWRLEDRDWQNWVPVSLGRLGCEDLVRDVWCRANFRRIQPQWRFTANTGFRVNRIDLEVEPRAR